MYCWIAAVSRSHLDSKSGLGFPIKFFSPSTKKKVTASPRPRPIHAVFHSQSLYLHVLKTEVGADAGTLGVKMSATRAVTIAGITREIENSAPVGTFSCSTYGKDMLGSTGENGRWYGLAFQKLVPIAAIPLYTLSTTHSQKEVKHTHDDYPVKSI